MNFNMSDIVCDCNSVEVGDVIDYLRYPTTDLNHIEDILEELDIGTRCGCCKDDDCSRIDVFYKDLIDFVREERNNQ